MTNDPTKDPEFQKVVRGFLMTKPKPHNGSSKPNRPERKRKKAALNPAAARAPKRQA